MSRTKLPSSGQTRYPVTGKAEFPFSVVAHLTICMEMWQSPVYCNSLENCRVERLREFESHRFRQICLSVYGYPYVSSESPKTLVTVPEARSRLTLSKSCAHLGHCVAINKFIFGLIVYRLV